MFKKLTQNSIYKDAWLELFQDEIEYPNGEKGTYAWGDRKNGVAIVVVTHDKKILLHHEYRYVVKNYSWEIQGGGIDDGETPEQAAVRELKEEAGISVNLGAIEKVGLFYPLNSFSTQSVTLFMVLVDPTAVNTNGTEASESIGEQRFVSFDEALEMIDAGLIDDALTANAVQVVIRRVNRNV